MVDATSAVTEPDTRADNASAARPVALSSPFGDLAVTAVTAPAAGSAGGPLALGWTVRNLGDSATSAASWTDAVYLSADAVVDAGDTLLGTVTHLGRSPRGRATTPP